MTKGELIEFLDDLDIADVPDEAEICIERLDQYDELVAEPVDLSSLKVQWEWIGEDDCESTEDIDIFDDEPEVE